MDGNPRDMRDPIALGAVLMQLREEHKEEVVTVDLTDWTAIENSRPLTMSELYDTYMPSIAVMNYDETEE